MCTIGRRRDAQKRIIQKHRLPQLNPNYYITAMDEYIHYFKRTDPSAKVNTGQLVSYILHVA